MCETKTNSDLSVFIEKELPDFVCLQARRTDAMASNSIAMGGGVAMLLSKSLWESYNIRRVHKDARSSIWVEMDAFLSSDVEKLPILVGGWYLPPENSGVRGEADREHLFEQVVEIITEHRDGDDDQRRQLILAGDSNGRVGNSVDLKTVFSEDGLIDLVGPPRGENTDVVINDNGTFLTLLCEKREWNLFFLSGRVFSNDWTFWNYAGMSNNDNWIATEPFLEGVGKKFTPADSDHAMLALTFDVVCDGKHIDEYKLVQGCTRGPWFLDTMHVTNCIIDMDVHAQLSRDGNLCDATEQRRRVVHEGATRLEAERVMDRWIERVQNSVLVKWIECTGTSKKTREMPKPIPLANDRRRRFNAAQRKWRKNFKGMTRQEIKGDIFIEAEEMALREEMLEHKKAVRKIERCERKRRLTIFWSDMQTRVGSLKWRQQLRRKKKRDCGKLDIKHLISDLEKSMGKNSRKLPEEFDQNDDDWEWPECDTDFCEGEWCFTDIEGSEVIDEILEKDKTFWCFKRRKAPGPDGWPYELLSALHLIDQTREALNDMMRCISTFASLPRIARRTSIVTMLEPTILGVVPSDFRRLSLASTIKRMAEKLCCKAMLTQYKVVETQGGYRKNRSCSGRLLILAATRAHAVFQGWQRCIVVLIDFRTFFDTICTERVCRHLRRQQEMTLATQLSRILKQFGNQSTQLMVHGEQSSGQLSMDSRLPQGSCWSPLLACLALDSGTGTMLCKKQETLHDGLPKLNDKKLCHSFFADDLLFVAGNTMVLVRLIETLLESATIENYKINWEKCDILCMLLKKSARRIKKLYHGLIQDSGKPKKYLGVLIQEDGEFDDHIKLMVKKLGWAGSEVLALIGERKGMPWSTRTILRNSLMRGAIGHAQDIWLAEHTKLLTRAENRLIRKIYGSCRRTAFECFWWISKLRPIETDGKVRALKLAAQVLDFDDDVLEKDALIELQKLHAIKGEGWYSDVVAIVQSTKKWRQLKLDKLLSRRQKEGYFTSKELRMYATELRNESRDAIRERLSREGSKHRFLTHCIPNWSSRRPTHLMGLGTLQSASLRRFLLGEHYLQVETGRWSRTDHDERFCKRCLTERNVAEICDEWHVLGDKCVRCSIKRENIKKFITEKLTDRRIKYKDNYTLAELLPFVCRLKGQEYDECWNRVSGLFASIEAEYF